MSKLDRLSRIAARVAKRHGATAAVYASAQSFDVLCERWRAVQGQRQYDGMVWIKNKTEDAYSRPATVARAIRRDMQRAFA